MTSRLENLRTVLQEKRLDAIFISTPENRRYMSGFSGSAGYLLITPRDAILATDFRYVEQAARQAPDFRVHRISSGSQWFVDLIREAAVRRVGFESEDVSVATHRRLRRALTEHAPSSNVTMVATVGIVEELRSRKDQDEMVLLQRAIDISDEALNTVTANIKAGETEISVGRRLEAAMRELGADGPSFDTIVGSGPNGALPHYLAGDRPIQEGEPVVIDMGAKYKGYCSDLTRTIILGTPDETFRRVYDVVLGAQLTAMATVQVGMTGSQTDGLARKVIEEAGYGDNFGHGLGHGVGLAVHEYPRVGPMGSDILENGMMFTIEPGIYISGWGGVRIEDVVILEDSGARTLSKARKLERIGG